MKPRIAVIGSTLEGVACAHSILDQKPEYQISLITEDAEVGFPEEGESPGLVEFKEWGGIPEDWGLEVPLPSSWTYSRSCDGGDRDTRVAGSLVG